MLIIHFYIILELNKSFKVIFYSFKPFNVQKTSLNIFILFISVAF